MDALSKLLSEGLKELLKDQLKDIVKEAIREMTFEGQGILPHVVDDVSLLDRRDAAKFLNISLPTLDLYSKEGVINARRIGKKILYRKDELITAGKKVAVNKYKRNLYA